MSDQDKSQKPEEPTGKRLAEAHDKGQVPKSTEVSIWVMLAASTLVLALFVDGIAIGVANEVYRFLAAPHLIAVDAEGAMDLIRMIFYRIGAARLRLNVKNLTDREYFLRGFGGTSVIPAPPISAFFSVDVRM